MSTAPGAEPPPLLLLTFGVAARTLDAASTVGRAARGAVRAVPLVGARVDAVTESTLARGERAVRATAELARATLRVVVREVVAAALLEVDLTRIVREYVDLDLIAEGIDVDAIAGRIDLDAIVRRLDLDALVDTVDLGRQVDRIDVDEIARRLDIDAVIARMDLIELAGNIIEGVDLPDIIRESTGSLSSEAVRGVRSQGMQADDAVAGFVGRLFGRDPGPDAAPRGDDDAGHGESEPGVR